METINNPLKCAGLLFLMMLPSLAAADSSGGYIGNIAPMRERVQQMEAFWKQKRQRCCHSSCANRALTSGS